MKSRNCLLVVLTFASSCALAQSAQQLPQPASGSMSDSGTATAPARESQLPAPTMGSGSQAPLATENGGGESSGAKDMSSSASGSGGQLITPDIAQSRPAGESTGIAVKPQTENGVTYMCGGIGKDESSYMKTTAAKDYDLMMTFADRSGSYVADVDVSIVDARGRTVLETTCDAPILLVDLPAGGKYRVHADARGRSLDRTAAVRNGAGQLRTLPFVWPSSVSPATESSGSSGNGAGGSGASGASGRDRAW